MSNLANQPMGTPQQSDGGHVPPPPPQYDYVVTKSPAGDQVPPVQAPTAHYPALSPTQHPAAAEGHVTLPPGYVTAPTIVHVVGMPGVPSPYATFGEIPVTMTCPACNSTITTSTEYRIGTYTWMMGGIIAMIGLFTFLPAVLFCCVPCCIPSCKDVYHHCPNCDKCVGHYQRKM